MVLGLRQFSARTGEPILDTGGGEELVHVQPSVYIALGDRAPESPSALSTSPRNKWCG
ncbi:hypothetical protein SLEP1_g42186 [Rubroshorea leprosula]|uniref:Uncharacterized protein n=1 Tax=Rubroshorea leprosula TaxID=152421 RepID=A0AAV5L8Z7_9ROSI|nr:hypothetical protein SLEP1_g42186 [Rubroshorea leprosula]